MVATDDTMTRSENREGIGTIGTGYRTNGLRLADVPSHPGIRQGLSIRNVEQLVPHFFLEICTRKQQRHTELPAFAAEVGIQLACRLLHHVRRAFYKLGSQNPCQPAAHPMMMLLHQPVAQTKLVTERAQLQGAERRLILPCQDMKRLSQYAASNSRKKRVSFSENMRRSLT